MSEYRLPTLPTGEKLKEIPQACGGDKCSKCALHNDLCYGCKPNPTVSCGTQQTCITDCQQCHGEPPIQGVCCKSPLAPFAVEKIKTIRELKYKPVPMLDFPDERIPILLDRHHRSPAPVNCVGINRIYSFRKKWKSRDIKDYLQLDKSTKLILSTVMTDNHLERLMDDRWWETAEEVGIDYWEPMLFSMFMNESKMQRLLSCWRTFKSLSDSGAHIAPFTFQHLASFNLESVFMDSLRAVRNIGVGLSHGSENHDAQRRTFGYVKKYASMLGPMAWFTQGLTAEPKRLVFKSLLPKGSKVYYFITPKTGARLTDDQYGWYS